MERLLHILRDHIFWKALLVVFCIFAFIFLYVNEFKQFNLMIDAKALIVPTVLTFLGFGLILGGWLQNKFSDPIEKLRTFMACLIISVIIAPFFASTSNRLMSLKPIRYEVVEFQASQAFYASRLGRMKGEILKPTGYHIFFIYKNEEIRISLKDTPPPLPEPGQAILIPIRKGFWGTEYIVPKAFGKQLYPQES